MMNRRSGGSKKGKQIPQRQDKKWVPKRQTKYEAADDDEEIDSDEAFKRRAYSIKEYKFNNSLDWFQKWLALASATE